MQCRKKRSVSGPMHDYIGVKFQLQSAVLVLFWFIISRATNGFAQKCCYIRIHRLWPMRLVTMRWPMNLLGLRPMAIGSRAMVSIASVNRSLIRCCRYCYHRLVVYCYLVLTMRMMSWLLVLGLLLRLLFVHHCCCNSTRNLYRWRDNLLNQLRFVAFYILGEV